MDRALAAGISLPGVVVVGMVNAVGGGILRDVLVNASSLKCSSPEHWSRR